MQLACTWLTAFGCMLPILAILSRFDGRHVLRSESTPEAFCDTSATEQTGFQNLMPL